MLNITYGYTVWIMAYAYHIRNVLKYAENKQFSWIFKVLWVTC